MRPLSAIVVGLLAMSCLEPLYADTHPRIWLTPTVLSTPIGRTCGRTPTSF